MPQESASKNDRPLSGINFVAFDVETTGLDSATERIVEIGAVRFDGGGISGELRRLINPGRPIPTQAVDIHGITDEMVASAPAISAALPDVVAFFGDAALIAHNAQFDIGFFDAAFSRTNMEPPRSPILCTLRLSRAMFPGLPSHALEALARDLNIPPGTHHRAADDAAHAAEVFRRCIDKLEGGWNAGIGELLKRHGTPYRFGNRFANRFDNRPDPDKATGSLAKIKDAIEKGRSVKIEYRGSDGKTTSRAISPLSINESGPHIKIVAFCHLRSEKRTFRIDCIQKIE
jgi:DNA polymerase III epsilon subunit family exonuclease